MRVLPVVLVIALCPRVAAAQGRELGLSLERPVKNLTVSGQLRLPPDGEPARCVLVLVNWPMSRGVFESPRWRESLDSLGCAMLLATFDAPTDQDLPPEQQPVRNAAVGGAEALSILLERFAVRVRHPELRSVPLLFWGFSASGSFGTTFGGLHPERTIAVVRFQSHTRTIPVDHRRIKEIPHLLIAGGDDETAGTEDALRMWNGGRRAGAPWTFVIQPGIGHGQGLAEATDLTLAWIIGVVRQRTAGRGGLTEIDSESTWYGHLRTLTTAPGLPDPSQELESSWLPDERTARLWRALMAAKP